GLFSRGVSEAHGLSGQRTCSPVVNHYSWRPPRTNSRRSSTTQEELLSLKDVSGASLQFSQQLAVNRRGDCAPDAAIPRGGSAKIGQFFIEKDCLRRSKWWTSAQERQGLYSRQAAIPSVRQAGPRRLSICSLPLREVATRNRSLPFRFRNRHSRLLENGFRLQANLSSATDRDGQATGARFSICLAAMASHAYGDSTSIPNQEELR